MNIRKYNFDLEYFKAIDSNEKAYWLGFIYADGNVYKYTLGIKLAGCDLSVLEKFKQDISADCPIKSVKNKDAYVIKIHSKELVYQLKLLGVVANKSNKISWPPIRKEFFPAFVLGFYDGDGWISVKRDVKNPAWLSWTVGFASCSQEFVKSLKKLLNEYGCGNGYYVTRPGKGKRNTIYQLCYYGQSAKRVLDQIYCVDFNIKRKRNRYEDFSKYLESKASKKISKYMGVSFDKKYKKWHSRIQHGDKRVLIGFYESELEAAIAYNKFIDEHGIPKYKKNEMPSNEKKKDNTEEYAEGLQQTC
jgi:hypothetical protein